MKTIRPNSPSASLSRFAATIATALLALAPAAQAELSIDQSKTKPTEGIIFGVGSSVVNNSGNTGYTNASATNKTYGGNTFILPTATNLSAITLFLTKANNPQTTVTPFRISIVEFATPITGTSEVGDLTNYTLKFYEDVTTPSDPLSINEYTTFTFNDPLDADGNITTTYLEAGKTYGFIMEFLESTSGRSFEFRSTTKGGEDANSILFRLKDNEGTITRDAISTTELYFLLSGATPIPEPAQGAGLLGVIVLTGVVGLRRSRRA